MAKVAASQMNVIMEIAVHNIKITIQINNKNA
jgi:hypothetical protein